MACVFFFFLSVHAVHAGSSAGADYVDDIGTNAAEAPETETISFLCIETGHKGIITLPRISCAIAYLAFKVMQGTAMLFGLAGIGLNYAVLWFVTGMGQFVLELGIGTPWSILRDVANVFLVFITLFMGIATILGISSYGYKTLLWKIILAALLVNFSLFFTQVVVDVSNLSAHAIYTQLEGAAGRLETKQSAQKCVHTDVKQLLTNTTSDNPCLSYGIAGAFMKHMGLQGIFSGISKHVKAIPVGKQDAAREKIIEDLYERLTLTSLLGAVMFLVGAFVFGAALLMLVSRFVTLVILMIFSAPAFVLLITGKGGGGSGWWNKLLKEAFFAPAFFLMIWISLVMLSRTTAYFNVGNKHQDLNAAADGNVGSIQLVFNFLVVCAFLIASLIVARSMGARGAAGAISIGIRWSRSAGMMVGAGAGMATVGVAGALGRRYIGAAGAGMAENRNVLERAKNKGVSGWVARQQIKLGERTARASFDARSLIGKDGQKWTGQAQKGGYAQNLKDWKKEESDLNKKLATPSMTREQKQDIAATGKAEAKARRDLSQHESTVRALNEELLNAPVTGANPDDIKKMIARAEQERAVAEATLKAARDERTAKRDAHTKEAKNAAEARVMERAEQVESQNTGLGAFWDPYTRGERQQLAAEARKVLKEGKKGKAEKILDLLKEGEETKKTEGGSTEEGGKK